MPIHALRNALFVWSVLANLSLAHAALAGSQPFKVWVAANLPGSPEGLALGPDGFLYATIPKTGEIVRLDSRGGFKHIATVPSVEPAKNGRVWGAAFGRHGELYVAYLWAYSLQEEDDQFHLACRNSQDIYTGIYKVDVGTGEVAPFITKRDGWPVCFPDDIAVDRKGDLYVADATLSGIWKLDASGTRFALWSTDPLLQWPAAPLRTLPEGANDLVLSPDQRTLYVATDGYPAVVAIPIRDDGTAGPAAALAHDLSPLDGIEIDPEGNIYVSEILRDTIRVFSPDGLRHAVVASAETAPLSGPTSLVYRNGALCVANFGWDVAPEPTTVVCMTGFSKPVSGHAGISATSGSPSAAHDK